jgi:hypothetical protein
MTDGMLFLSGFFIELILLYIFSQLLQKKLSLLFYHTTHNKTLTIRLLSFFFFPGVFVHEIAHYLAALFLFVPAGNIEFMPVVREGSVKLGSVSIAKTDPFRRMIIGVAPVLVGLSLIFFIVWFGFSQIQKSGFPQFYWIVIVGYCLFVVGNTMFSSKKDMEGAVELIGTLVIVILLLYFFGLRVPLGWLETLINQQKELIKTADFYLLVPLLIDAIVYVSMRVLLKG